ncbi:MAG: gliding motility-associated C-terminal domain-containing protein [Bacteroidota bacterium]
MKCLTTVLLFCTSLALSTSLSAQVNAPTFLCVQSDTLFWELPTNNCGPFNAYVVYASNTLGGPFEVLANITDPDRDFFHHPNPQGLVWYYYLESDHDCPGQVVLQSETLDNRAPQVAPIESVTVEGEDVLIFWNPSPSPEVVAYIIYREEEFGTVPIDTVFGDVTTYRDTTATPLLNPEIYFIIPIDACGNTSIFQGPHRSLLIETQVNICEQSITLSWDPYDGWTDGILRQEVWLSVDGSTPQRWVELGPTDTTYTFENALKSEFYEFFIRAFSVKGSSVSDSGVRGLRPDLIQAVRTLALQNISVTPDNNVEIYWTWNTDAEVQTVEVFSSTNNASFELVDAQNPANPLQTNNRITEVLSTPETSSVFYQLQSTDLCDSSFLSNTGQTIFLTGTAQQDLSNRLEWNPFVLDDVRVVNYELYRTVAGTTQLLELLPPTTTSYVDNVNPDNNDESNVCYLVVAVTEFTLPNGSTRAFRARSNQTCVEQFTKIYVPNAFAPSGVNTRFRPVLVFDQNVDYHMVILDRWGGVLFETSDPDDGWTGRDGLRLLPMGTYSYVIRVTQPNGRQIKETGVVVLVR